MFENLTAREKKLAMIIGALAPLLLVTLALFWFFEKYSTNQVQINGLETTIELEEAKTKLGLQALTRKTYYLESSLPSRVAKAKTMYQSWLKDLVRDDIKMDYFGVKQTDDGSLENNGQRIGYKTKYTLRPEATYAQVLRFLHEFYSADHLHRINSLSIRPIAKVGKDKKKALTGKLKLTIEIEVLSLVEADPEFDSFPRYYRQLDKEIADYETSILGRNIFGPANNVPVLDVTQSGSYLPGKPISLTLRATDADPDDLMQFELLESECDITGITFGAQPTMANKRTIAVKVPAQEEDGRYKIKARVFDNGYPSKSSEKSFTIVVMTPKEKPKQKPKPPYEFAKQAFVVAHLRAVDGQWEIVINVRPKKKIVKLRQGDVLDLDDKEWVLETVNEDTIVFKVADELLTIDPGGTLGNPLERETIEAEAEAKASASATVAPTAGETIDLEE